MWNPLRRRHEPELDEELRFHLEEQIQSYVDDPLSPEEARRRAQIDPGGLAQVKDACREVRPLYWLRDAARELRMTFRLFGRNPAFTLACILTLGLGIAASTTVFTIANGLVLKGPPFEDARRVVHVYEFDRSRGPGIRGGSVSFPDFLDFREQNRSFADLAMYGIGTYNLSDDISLPERVQGSRITPNLFRLIGYQPALGRDFLAGEDAPGVNPVAIISHALWQARYGGRPDILGSELRANGAVHTVVGVMPERMKFPVNSELWLPLSTEPTDRGDRGGFEVVGRLRSGVSFDQARTDLQEIAARLRAEYPRTNENIDAALIPFADRFTDPNNASVFTALFGAVGFVLLIVCANLAGLMLARSVRQTRETAIRIALGASRWQVIRHALTQTLTLSMLGGALGLILASIAVHLMAGELAGVGLPYWVNFSIDYRVVFQLVAVCVVTGVLVGVAPALQIARTDVRPRLSEGTPAAGSSRRSGWLASILVASEIALTLVLMVGAGIMIRSFLNFQSRGSGVRTQNMLTATLILPPEQYPEPADWIRFTDNLMARLEVRPDLGRVTMASHAPVTGAFRLTVQLDDVELNSVATLAVAPGYFDAIGVGVTRGRDFSRTDGVRGNAVAIVNERLASDQWPGDDAVGKGFRFADGPDAPFMTVVGVTRDVAIGNETEPIVYVPYQQEPASLLVIVAQDPPSIDAAAKTLRTEVQELDSGLPLFNIRTVDHYLWRLSVGNRVLGSLFTAFALIALAVSMVGIYGVTAYAAGRRRREIGIRMALGATSRSVLWLAARSGIRQAVIGLTLGLGGAWAVSRIIFSRVVAGLPGQASPADTVTFLAVPILLALATLIACLSPARQAARTDPTVALRAE